MHVRSLVAAAAILALSCGIATARDLTVVARGPTQEAIKRVFIQPFTTATGIAVQSESWGGGIDALRTQSKAPDNVWDLVQVDSDELTTGCSEGLFEKLDWSAIGGKDHYLPQAVSDCGVGSGLASLVLAWDRDKFPATPGWADFWDVAKYPASVGCTAASAAIWSSRCSPMASHRPTSTRYSPPRKVSIAPFAVWIS